MNNSAPCTSLLHTTTTNSSPLIIAGTISQITTNVGSSPPPLVPLTVLSSPPALISTKSSSFNTVLSKEPKTLNHSKFVQFQMNKKNIKKIHEIIYLSY